MNVDLPELISALAGYPLAGVALGVAFLYWRALKRIDVLTDRIMDMSAETIKAMNDLANQIEKAGR